jgi:hypothetical protein
MADVATEKVVRFKLLQSAADIGNRSQWSLEVTIVAGGERGNSSQL